MTCYDPQTVRESLIGRLCAIEVGEYTIEYINSTSIRPWDNPEYIGVIERPGGVIDTIDLDSNFFESLVKEYGATGIKEQY